MRNLLIAISFMFLAGCSTFLPPKHDNIIFFEMVKIDIMMEGIPCPENMIPYWLPWAVIAEDLQILVRYADWRHDPQLDNIIGMYNNAKKLSVPDVIKTRAFCELSKKVARERIGALRHAWEGR